MREHSAGFCLGGVGARIRHPDAVDPQALAAGRATGAPGADGAPGDDGADGQDGEDGAAAVVPALCPCPYSAVSNTLSNPDWSDPSVVKVQLTGFFGSNAQHFCNLRSIDVK